MEALKACLTSADPGEARAAASLAARLYVDQPKILPGFCQDALDRPRVLQMLVDAIEIRFLQLPKKNLAALLKVLGKTAVTLPQRLALTARGLPLDEFLSKVEEELKADPVGWDIHLAAQATFPKTYKALQAGTLEKVLARWQNDADPRLRRLALEWLIQAAARQGWPEPLREALKQFQADPAAVVAGLAQFTFPPDS